MTILNESLDWNRISVSPNIARAFRGTPAKTLIPQRQMLCRFITIESKKRGIRGNEIFFSPWWMDWSTTWSMLSQWKTAKATPKDMVRAKLAVTTDFSQELDSVVQ